MKTHTNQSSPHKAENLDNEAMCTGGLYCAETVLSVIAHEHDIESPLIPRIATGLCSGMARTCGTCGALTGGILALNIIHGRSTPDESVEHNYALVEELIKRFVNAHKSTNCAELLGCDLATEKGQHRFETENLVEQCAAYTRKSISIVRELLAGDASPSNFNPENNGKPSG